ncbi:unnamed protein product, partial [marine sediment metagenome]
MPRRNTLVSIAILIIFILCLLVILPINQGLLGQKDFMLGLDLQGGLHL